MLNAKNIVLRRTINIFSMIELFSKDQNSSALVYFLCSGLIIDLPRKSAEWVGACRVFAEVFSVLHTREYLFGVVDANE